jgi:hypothetical protein
MGEKHGPADRQHGRNHRVVWVFFFFFFACSKNIWDNRHLISEGFLGGKSDFAEYMSESIQNSDTQGLQGLQGFQGFQDDPH